MKSTKQMLVVYLIQFATQYQNTCFTLYENVEIVI